MNDQNDSAGVAPSEQTVSKRRSRALPPDIKAMKAIKRAVDALEPHEKQRVMEWAMAYVEGVGQSSSARYRMALEAILCTSHFDAPAIARRALGSSRSWHSGAVAHESVPKRAR